MERAIIVIGKLFPTICCYFAFIIRFFVVVVVSIKLQYIQPSTIIEWNRGVFLPCYFVPFRRTEWNWFINCPEHSTMFLVFSNLVSFSVQWTTYTQQFIQVGCTVSDDPNVAILWNNFERMVIILLAENMTNSHTYTINGLHFAHFHIP